MITFDEMKYERPDLDQVQDELSGYVKDLKKAENYSQARDVFLAQDKALRHVATLSTLAQIRHDINTNDGYYKAENEFWLAAAPHLQEQEQAFTDALLVSPFRSDFEKEFGRIVFLNAEIARKAFSADNIPDMQKENQLAQDYENLLASAQVPFEGKTYTLSQMTPFKNDPDDARRLAAWKAEGQWYKDHQPQMDEIYDQLVHLRDAMGRRMGYEGYTTLGYYRMDRNCYTKEDLAKFRDAVAKYVVPVAERVYKAQAERLGVSYPMNFADAALEFRSGNAKPAGSADDIIAAGTKFYDELSPETSEFFHAMKDMKLMNLLSTEGKAGGGYCTDLGDYHMPFIFANFNGTQGDVEVITHEAGHAFEAYLNRSRVPMRTMWPTMEACECHSMSMEFFGQEWADDFFGKDARKYRYSHVAGAIRFIPYGTAVDEFQHEIYAHPELTPRQRHDVWKKLCGKYMPWYRLDGEIPFYSDGEHWQLKHHIYSSPFYYIDYCLAQTVSLQFWAMIQKDEKTAWNTYMAYTEQGGSDTWTNMLKKAGLASPFDGSTLKDICEKAGQYLDAYDLSGIE
ncbi:M3 family oligoendopeptidase [Lactimicrobium massiliense]|uniref:M3 family oligoendopeptidase n=1 Tax=Lactimicrobium massiliense TaxID=2161814 RepID=UPI001AE163FD|nr:M3 family oligoendopeptidase [Lactimicrobium massiliense]